MGSLLRRAHFESLRAAEAKNAATRPRVVVPVMHSRGTLTSIILGVH